MFGNIHAKSNVFAGTSVSVELVSILIIGRQARSSIVLLN